MIANFYKRVSFEDNTVNSYKLFASKNIDCIPPIGTMITFSGQSFVVHDVVFDIDTCEYSLYLKRTSFMLRWH
jgi:hypothetical protein